MSDSPPILVAGTWRPATAVETFQAYDPSTGTPHDSAWPVSGWADVDAALDAAVDAARQLATLSDENRAEFLERYATRLEAKAADLVVQRLKTALGARQRNHMGALAGKLHRHSAANAARGACDEGNAILKNKRHEGLRPAAAAAASSLSPPRPAGTTGCGRDRRKYP